MMIHDLICFVSVFSPASSDYVDLVVVVFFLYKQCGVDASTSLSFFNKNAIFYFNMCVRFRVVVKKHRRDHVWARAIPSHPNRVRWPIVQRMVGTPLIIRHCTKPPGMCIIQSAW